MLAERGTIDFFVETREEKAERMRAIYAGSIAADGSPTLEGVPMADRQPNANRMHALMVEWNPVLSDTAELKAIIGEPTRVEGDVLVYAFTTSFGYREWRFTVRGGRVVGVRYE